MIKPHPWLGAPHLGVAVEFRHQYLRTMAGSTRETDELSIQVAILEAMQDGRIWSNADLKRKLCDALPWTPEERSASPSRPNEFLWENRVNNALSPSRSSSLYAKRFVENVGRGEHRITAEGLSFINDEDFSVDDLLIGIQRAACRWRAKDSRWS